MNRTLRRPMFRMGGSAEGITSGLDAPAINKRGLVDGPGGYSGEEGDDLESRYNRAMDFIQSKRAPRGSNFNDFLISYGLDLASRPKSGNILQQLATSARDPFKQFQSRREMYRSEDDKLSQALAGDIMEQMGKEKVAEIKGKYDVEAEKVGATGESEFERVTRANLSNEFYNGKIKQQEQLLANANAPEREAIQSEINALKEKRDDDYRSIISGEMSEDAFVKDIIIAGVKNDIFDPAKVAKKYPALADLLYDDMAKGGRVGLQMGGDVMPEAMTMDQGTTQDSPVQNLSFEELRSRLPNSITDDIITLIANSEQALVDFANIQTQQDVNAFNQKYEVNLQMPAEA